ncbi:hypothetical protein M0L20_10745 [Spirosoma sp. RP8]|uniref:Uncharacterized protein n=1 Tax=Spirosoma liriopis TaxID=2937440 RepID=A0ABT0HJI8_9BACT|nr:hypothetical protein [Spirosoma liriopis]MCK8492328.1 hypothetical protein [Spirosoma liriopis]
MTTPFSENAGRFLNSSETKSMKEAYRDRKLAVGLSTDDYVRSEYFGINQIKELLNHPDCVGLRVHHAKRWEDTDGNPTEVGVGQLKPRVLLTAVNAKGKNIGVNSGSAGLKDMNQNAATLGDGLPCPRHCGGDEDN